VTQASLHGRLRAEAERRPDALALQCGAQTLSYSALDALVTQRCDELRAARLGAGDFIGWLGLNSPQVLATLLACSRLGAVFVPLNWRLAPPELAAIVAHSGLSVLQATPELALLADQVRVLAPPSGPTAPAQPGDLLLVHTSGTGGHARGAMHTQAGLLANIDIACEVQGIEASSRVLSVLPLFHVGGLCIQTLPALASGAAVRLQERFDPSAWLRDVAAWRADTSVLVPAAMRALVEHPLWPSTDLSSLRFVNSGSQIVPVALIEAFHARGVPVAQVYGCTESGPFSVALRPDEALAHVGQAGRAVPGVDLRLVDEQGAEVKAGEIGEILLRAPNLMRGYHPPGDHPAGDRPHAGSGLVDGWLATGDLARADAQGYLTVVGRRSDRIISGGENIDPAEIEQLAAAWPGVAEAVVLGVPDARWGEVPVLVLAAKAGAAVDAAALAASFDGRLARFKQPRRIVLLEALPRTALGKVRKAALRRSLVDAENDSRDDVD
jgi:fatty-acyl-CoA synthase